RAKPGVLGPGGVLRRLEHVVADIGGDVLNATSLARIAALDLNQLPRVADVPRYGPAVAGVGKMICVGLNYADHAAESGMAVPNEPVLFMMAASAISRPNAPVVIPRGAARTDLE